MSTPSKPISPHSQIRFDSVAELKDYLAAARVESENRNVERPTSPEPTDGGEAEDGEVAEGEITTEDKTFNNPKEGNWGGAPSVIDQLTKHPGTVRFGPFQTRQFILSDQKQLKEWNLLQAEAHPLTSARKQLAFECTFAPALSSFVVLATFSEIEYQQL